MLNWFAKRMKEARENESGFTLIELLVVVIIIGILAAIAIPTFLAQRERGWESAAQSDLRNAAAAATSCSTANSGSYGNCDTVGDLTSYGFNNTDDVTLSSIVGDAAHWQADSKHDLDDTVYRFNTAAGGQVRCVTACP